MARRKTKTFGEELGELFGGFYSDISSFDFTELGRKVFRTSLKTLAWSLVVLFLLLVATGFSWRMMYQATQGGTFGYGAIFLGILASFLTMLSIVMLVLLLTPLKIVGGLQWFIRIVTIALVIGTAVSLITIFSGEITAGKILSAGLIVVTASVVAVILAGQMGSVSKAVSSPSSPAKETGGLAAWKIATLTVLGVCVILLALWLLLEEQRIQNGQPITDPCISPMDPRWMTVRTFEVAPKRGRIEWYNLQSGRWTRAETVPRQGCVSLYLDDEFMGEDCIGEKLTLAQKKDDKSPRRIGIGASSKGPGSVRLHICQQW